MKLNKYIRLEVINLEIKKSQTYFYFLAKSIKIWIYFVSRLRHFRIVNYIIDILNTHFALLRHYIRRRYIFWWLYFCWSVKIWSNICRFCHSWCNVIISCVANRCIRSTLPLIPLLSWLVSLIIPTLVAWNIVSRPTLTIGTKIIGAILTSIPILTILTSVPVLTILPLIPILTLTVLSSIIDVFRQLICDSFLKFTKSRLITGFSVNIFRKFMANDIDLFQRNCISFWHLQEILIELYIRGMWRK